MLPTESTDKLVFFEFASVSVNKSSPFVHLVSSFLVEFVLELIVLLLELLGKFPDNIVLELEELSLLFVVLHENSTLS